VNFLLTGLAVTAAPSFVAGQAGDLAMLTVKQASDYDGLPTISVPCGFNAAGLPIGTSGGRR
jgi:Asp-tRNA(Asn)/Glu-tRNA(Gln) amidotransferase A subunit family amidase